MVGPESKELTKYAKEILRFLSSIDGIKDAEHDQDPGKIEFKYELNQEEKS